MGRDRLRFSFVASRKPMIPKISPMMAVMPQIPNTPRIKETVVGLVFLGGAAGGVDPD